MSRISYRDYLLDLVKIDPSVIPLYQSRTHGEWGVGIDAVSALDVWPFGLPGFQGLKLDPGSAPHMGYTPAGYALRQIDAVHAPLRVGDLIALRVEGRTALQAAVVRWFRNTMRGTGLEFGCELLTDSPEAAAGRGGRSGCRGQETEQREERERAWRSAGQGL